VQGVHARHGEVQAEEELDALVLEILAREARSRHVVDVELVAVLDGLHDQEGEPQPDRRHEPLHDVPVPAVLRGVDGIVFVADSQYDKMEENVESLANLEDNLKTLRMNIKDIPYVLQYNKRDLPNIAPVDYMEFLLNNREVHVPSFEAAAFNGEGVFETLNMITKMLLHKFINQGG